MIELSPGDLVSAPFFEGKAEIRIFEKKPSYYKIEIVILKNNELRTLLLTEDQLKKIKKIEQTQLISVNSEDFFFFIEANRIRAAYQFDPILAVNVSQVDPLPHQIEAVYSYALRDPKLRFLIADDAGAGKTIMAGLLLKELQYRNLANRILIVVPGHLKYQWQREMKEKFNTVFKIITRNVMNANFYENVWEESNLCITTLDFLRQDDIKNTMNNVYWDLVIFDEAHKLSAFRVGKNIRKTKRYRVGELLSKLSTHLLFLTATPHRGDEENFRLFLDLLRPGFFSKMSLLEDSVRNNENPLFIRRLKEDMVDFNGNKLFKPRNVITTKFNLNKEERDLYHNVTNYVKEYFDKAKENRNITFALIMLQRRLASSLQAILKSLINRKKKLEEYLELPEKLKEIEKVNLELNRVNFDDLEDEEEAEREKIYKKLENLTIANNIDDVKEEIAIIEILIEKAKEVKKQKVESKLTKLRDEVLRGLGDKKLLIFSEFRDTVNYLLEQLKEWGYKTTTINGSMQMEQRIDAERDFKDNAQIMVATEAAGEGINLQFCSFMVNYDIPWNPNRLEQRMGRIHRYGQNEEVFIYNMIAKNTREGQILDRLFQKLQKMGEDLGSDKVFDVIGEIMENVSLEDLIKKAIFEQEYIDDLLEQIDNIDVKELEKKLEKVFLTGLATKHIDVRSLLEKKTKADENRLMPEYIQDYFFRTLTRMEGNYERRKNSFRINSVPYDLRRISEDYSFKTKYGKVYKTYNYITFDKEIAKDNRNFDYIAPGHPLLEIINEYQFKKFEDKREIISSFIDETGSFYGLIWFYKGIIIDGSGEKSGSRIFTIYQANYEDSLTLINPSILWDFKPVKVDSSLDYTEFNEKKENIEKFLFNSCLTQYLDEIKKNRDREIKIKKKYGLKSIEYLIQDSNDKLLQFQNEMDKGKDMRLPITNEERRKEDLESKKDNLIQEIKLESNLTIIEPELMGIAAIIPIKEKPFIDDEPTLDEQQGGSSEQLYERRKKIENIGMEKSNQYEKDHGWHPEDVADDNLGFDIRSTKYDEEGIFEDIRYIEVKARALKGSIRISANEWKKANRFKDKFWLYIISNASTGNPELKRIQNPAEKLSIDEDIFATGYELPLEKWSQIE